MTNEERVQLEQRITRLEGGFDLLRAQFMTFSEASTADRKRLHDILDRQADALRDLKETLAAFKFRTELQDTGRTRFVAGAIAVMSLAGAGIAFLWEHLITWVAGK